MSQADADRIFRQFFGGMGGGMGGFSFGGGGFPGGGRRAGHNASMPNFGGFGGMDDEDYDDDDHYHAQAGMPRQAAPIETPLRLTLEELYTGVVKKLKITRKVLNPDQRSTRSEAKILEVPVKCGWKAGEGVKEENKFYLS